MQRIPDDVAGNFICVPDTVTALQAIAAFYRAQFDIPVIGITGSVGKTTAKDIIAAVLSQRSAVHKTAGNFNNDLGVPLTLFGLNDTHRYAVVEMGISHPDDMPRLAQMVRPDLMLYTNIGQAHLEYLKTPEGILAEKSRANEAMPAGGTVLINGDDALLRSMVCRQTKLSYGCGENCDVRAENAVTQSDGSLRCTIRYGDRTIDAHVNAYGDHMVYAALEGAAVGIALGLSDDEIAAGIAAYAPGAHRAQLIHTEKLTVIDDCYNASPSSTASAIRSLSHLAGRRVCILGDMLELGENAAAYHYEIGQLAAQCGIDVVLTAGNISDEISRGACSRAQHFADKADLIAALPQLIAAGDSVLVKASHSRGFDEICAALEKL